MAIAILPTSVVAGISAGEVIERPASVVKELIENSLDAGATRVKIEIAGGGMKRIRVADNGCGISQDEALLAFSRHATSKLSSLSDLQRIDSFGFRGEALAAITAAGDIEVLTRTASSDEGTRVTGDAGDKLKAKPAGCETGAAISVSNLFRKMPARLKFMKSPGAETAAVARALEPYALTRPDVHFVFSVDGVERLNAPVTEDLLARVQVVVGSAAQALKPFKATVGPIEVNGFAEPPGSVRKRGRYWLVVNSRPVEDKALRHALLAGYRGQIPREMFPTAVVFLRLPPDRLDVNVHPAKTEVRFADQHAVYECVSRALSDSFGARTGLDIRQSSSIPGIAGAAIQDSLPLVEGTASAVRRASESAPALDETHERVAGDIQILSQLFETYIVARDAQGLLIADQHAAHEKVIYDRLMRRKPDGATQRLLMSQKIDLSASEAALLENARAALEDLGFEFEGFGGRSVVIRSAPAQAHDRDLPGLLRQVLSDFEDTGRAARDTDLARRVCASVACHLAVKAGDRLTTREMEALMRELLELADPLSCPHGRPTIMRMDAAQLSRTFRRQET